MDTDRLSKNRLWHGALLGGIINAIKCAESASFDSVRQWVDNDYVRDGGDPRLGAVRFEHGLQSSDGFLVGLFFDPQSKISAYHFRDYDLNSILAPIPSSLKQIANDMVKEYMLDDEDENEPVPLVTTAIWCEGENDVINSAIPWDEAFEEGASLIENELRGADEEAIAGWQANYGLSPSELEFGSALYRMRIAKPGVDIVLDDVFVDEVMRSGVNPWLGMCRHHLGCMRIYIYGS